MSVLLDTSEPSERAPRLLNRPRGKLRLRFLSGGIVSRSSDADGSVICILQGLANTPIGTWSTYRIIRNRRLPHLTAVIILEMLARRVRTERML